MPPTLVQFAPLSSLAHPSFWHRLTELKLDVLKLSDDQVEIDGSYTVGRSIKDRDTGAVVGMNGSLAVQEESFTKELKCVRPPDDRTVPLSHIQLD